MLGFFMRQKTMWNNLKVIYSLQQRTDLYAETVEIMVSNIIDIMRKTIDKNTEKQLKELLISIEPYTNKIQKNISEYLKIIEESKN